MKIEQNIKRVKQLMGIIIESTDDYYIPYHIIKKLELDAEKQYEKNKKIDKQILENIKRLEDIKSKGTLDEKSEKLLRMLKDLIEHSKKTTKKYIFDALVSKYLEERKILNTKKITSQIISDLIVMAFEEGSIYWIDLKPNTIPNEIKSMIINQNIEPSKAISKHVMNGGDVFIYDYHNNVTSEEPVGVLNMNSILDGINFTKENDSELYLDILEEKYNSHHADCFLQYSLFGRLKY